MRIRIVTLIGSVIAAAAASAQPTPTPVPRNLPVIFESDDARDNLYEVATDALAQLHFAENVPLVQLTVPCGNGSTLSPDSCKNGTFHQRYRDWGLQHPGLIEIGQHGITHSEMLGNMTRAQQLDLIDRALQEMQTWGLPSGRPFSFGPPFSSENTDTISILEQLGFHTSIRNSDDCLPSSSMDNFCESVSVCQRDAGGNRVAGPSCVLLSPQTLINQVNARQSDGKVFVVYHVQDVLLPNLAAIDQSKMDAFRAILQAFRAEQSAGRYRLMTFDTYYRTVRGLPTATPPAQTTPTAPGPTPTRTPTPPAAATPTVPAGTLPVYQDALVSPWIDSSWSATIDYNNAGPVFSGTRSIKVVEAAWGALSVHRGNWGATQAINPSGYQSVDFMVFTPSSGFSLSVRLENDARAPFPEIVVGTMPANQWVSVSVSISQLDPGGQPFDRLDIFDHNGIARTYYVDDLRLTAKGAPTPTPPASPPPTATRTATPLGATPTPTATRQPDLSVYQDALVTPWIDSSWSATIDYNNTTPVFSGTRSIKVAETGWGALSMHRGNWGATQPIDPSRYQSVDFRVFSGSAGFSLSVRLENDASFVFPEVVVGTIAANQWVTISVPIAQLDPAGQPFDRVDIFDHNGVSRTYFVDAFRFTGK